MKMKLKNNLKKKVYSYKMITFEMGIINTRSRP